MNPSVNRRVETLIYAGLWLLVTVMYLLNIMRERSYTELPLLDAVTLWRMCLHLLPFVGLFLINNYLLIPQLLKRGKYGEYFLAALLIFVAICGWQFYDFKVIMDFNAEPKLPMPPHEGPHHLIPLPLFLDMIYDLLIVGVNLAISLTFQHFEDKFEQERLKKQNAENQLTYLKAQINPHFYMNMLNNIHGMIEIDSAKAQDMVIEMSRLMRYMLYDSSRPQIELSAEIGFIRNYFSIMRERYPEDAVRISMDIPDESRTTNIKVPPLLFIVFIENAFKHGISYNCDSFISVKLIVEHGKITFMCMNSLPHSGEKSRHEGIGLENARQRMDLIYGHNYSLVIDSTENAYSVNLTLPYETADTDN